MGGSFQAERMDVHDISVLKNTSFQQDAALLEPGSRKDLEQLIAMMNDNPAYKILIHTHCKKRSKRDIKVPPGSDCFDVDGAITKKASDKRLTKERGRALRNYLVKSGADRKRVRFIGWESLGMPDATTALGNRVAEVVEIELVDDGAGKSGNRLTLGLSAR